MLEVTLNNGVKMPILGFGTYFPNLVETEESVYCALMNGYRHLDTARWYKNEDLVANAIRRSGVKREELFITGKVESNGYERTKKDILTTMNDLGVDYLDLLLIHWPSGNDLDTYRCLEEFYREGKVRAIGLSNFNQRQCEEIISHCEIFPQVNQIETHIYFQEDKMHSFLQKVNIYHESWAPFAEGYMGMLEDETLLKIAKKYKKNVAQVILRFLIQQNIIVIPKSTKEGHIKENLDIFDFELSQEDFDRIRSLDRKEQYSPFPLCMKEETNY